MPILPSGFVSPWLLWGLFAMAVPLVIHLLSRRRYREMEWAAMEYLLAALRRSRRRMQLEQLLLLLLRTLIVALVVLAVAEPYLEESVFSFVPGEPTHRVLVVDGSFSMAYKPTDRSRFEQAKEIATRIVKESPKGDGFTLVLLSAPARVVVGNPVFDRRDFLSEIEGLVLPHGTADLPTTLTKVEEILAKARREHRRLTRQDVYFLTDLGRVGWWIDPADSAARAAVRKLWERLSNQARLAVIDVGQQGAENLAVTGLDCDESFAAVGRDLEVEAKVANFVPQARSRQTVQLLVDGRRVEQKYVDLAPARVSEDGPTEPAIGAVRFSYRFDTPGDHILEVRLAEDALDVDNHRWLALPVKPFVHVLCVDGGPSGGALGRATDYLITALAPESDPLGRSLFRPEVVGESQLSELDLDRYDCLFLCNVGQFTRDEARALDDYLKNGGGVVFFLGDRVLPEAYNRELRGNDPKSPARLLPARLGGLVTTHHNRLDPRGYDHPIVRNFAGHEEAGLSTTPVAQHFRLEIEKPSKAKIALAFDNGDPLIVEEPVHRGRVILFATAADDRFMPRWGHSFLPIVRDTLGYAIGEQIKQRNLEVGQPLGTTVSAEAADGPLTIRRPDGGRDQIKIRAEETSGTWGYSDTTTSGVYSAQFDSPEAPSQSFAVNVDPAESDLKRITPKKLEEEVLTGLPFQYQTGWEQVDAEPASRPHLGSGLAKALLYAVLVLLLAETLLAWRFGHHSR
ncbi:MAG: BatA domain-containing protein [Planctomycetota bacterium]|jgi:hypothetical protein